MMDNELINIRLSSGGTEVVILDQTLLPGETKYISLRNADDMYDAIYKLRVRGAPAIGIFAAFALYVLGRQSEASSYEHFRSEIKKHSAFLSSSRPTAVNLAKQLQRMENLVDRMEGAPIQVIQETMRNEAETIRSEDIEMCRTISEYGLRLLCGCADGHEGGREIAPGPDPAPGPLTHSYTCDDFAAGETSAPAHGFGVMTYCNAGPLATSRYGTALGPIFLAHERGIPLDVYCCETRPLLQGARLTSYELDRAGIDCTLICDNMASIVMSQGKIDAVFAGCDRAARNGDAANKIGTSGLAILAGHYGIPFYVFFPSSTFDPECATGRDIEIELRRADEIKELHFSSPVAPPGVKCYNPAFDVTDNSLITAIITEKGIFTAPYDESLRELC